MNLADLRALGVEVRLSEEGKLRLRAAPGVMTPQLWQATAEAKPRLLEELRGLGQAPVNVVNMVNFDAHCLTGGIGPSTASQKDHRASAAETVTVLQQPGARPDGGLSSEGEAAVLAWLDHIGETDQATIAEVLTACRRDEKARGYFLQCAGYSPWGGTTTCADCHDMRRPGNVVRYCAGRRNDLLPAYTEGHPLRRLPDDQGRSCSLFNPR